MNIWLTVLLAGLTTYFFRFAPSLFVSVAKLKQEHAIIKFFNYASCAILGALIYSISFNAAGMVEFFQHFDWVSILKLGAILMAFLIAIKTKGVFIAFFSSFFVYFCLVYFFA